MPLLPGVRVGPYEILAPLGAGGMGEVYRARDSRLGRDVAIKVLPAEYSRDPDRLRRFEQEARAAGMLNHPNILVIYDIGTHDGAPYVVSELLEGETLRARLAAGGALPQRKVLEYALEITRGLAAAHDKGIVHRDLKPENLFLTKAAGVKILDFGLAKLTHQDLEGATQGPTVAAATEPGVVMGTAGYMSPEQVRGQPADHRADVFAFGAILYEMLTGRRAFAGDTSIETMNAILKQDPPELAGASPLERLIRRCLEKAPEERFGSARDLAFALEALAGPSGVVSAPPAAAPRRSRRLIWLAAGLAVAAAAVGVLRLVRPGGPEPALVRFTVAPPDKTSLDGTLAASPDGKHVAFTVASAGGRTSLWVRSLDSPAPRELPGTEDASLPFWSPDSRSIGFFAAGKLKTVSLAAGSPQSLCDVWDARGGAWSKDGVIVISPGATDSLYLVPTAGGKPTRHTTLDRARGDTTHRWPQLLPGSRRLLFFIYSGKAATRGVYAGSLDSPETRLVLNTDRMGVYAPPASGRSGHLLYLRDATLMSQPFDAERLQLTGEPEPLGEPLWRHGTLWGLAAFSASHTGLLAYRTGGVENYQFVWHDRQGNSLGAVGPTGSYDDPWLAPDEKRLALVRDPAMSSAIWVLDLASGTLSRLTFDTAAHLSPVWSPDGRRIVFSADHEGVLDLYVKNADGSGQEEPLFRNELAKWPADWSLDGRYLLYETQTAKSLRDVWALPLEGDRRPLPVAQSEFDEGQCRFSPDGKWVAYSSNESARYEVYVQPFPPTGAKWQVSTEGGVQPQWRRDGKELFFLALDRKLMSAAVETGGGFQSAAPQALFQTQALGINRRFGATQDGRRFLTIIPVRDPSPITVVLNWRLGLKR